jgi:predicted transcriptional regulator
MKTKVFYDGFDGHVQRSLARIANMKKGENLEPERIVTFADPLDLMACFTPDRIRLYQAVGSKQRCISALAEELGRNRSAVTRDAAELEKLGFLKVRKIKTGRRMIRMVERIAEEIVIFGEEAERVTTNSQSTCREAPHDSA